MDKAFVSVDEVKPGTVLIPDGGFVASNPDDPGDDDFRCLAEGERVVVQADENGELFVPCKCGGHHLEGQFEDGVYVGLWLADE